MKQILLASGDVGAARAIHEALERAGYAVQYADSVDAAWGAMSNALPDLLILDANLPEDGGWAMLERFHTVHGWRRLPIVFAVNQAEQADVFRGWKLGVATYLSMNRPVDEKLTGELLAKLKRIFKSIEEERNAEQR
jgi:DNA-binding response OmpR family regulator